MTALLDEVGYQHLTVEAVAARAGVGRTTVYRWWPTKAALIIEALGATLPRVAVGITDDGRRDLRTVLDRMARAECGPRMAETLPALAAEARRDPDTAARLTGLLGPRRAADAAVLLAAAARGDIPLHVDVSLVLDIALGTLLWRRLRGKNRPPPRWTPSPTCSSAPPEPTRPDLGRAVVVPSRVTTVESTTDGAGVVDTLPRTHHDERGPRDRTGRRDPGVPVLPRRSQGAGHAVQALPRRHPGGGPRTRRGLSALQRGHQAGRGALQALSGRPPPGSPLLGLRLWWRLVQGRGGGDEADRAAGAVRAGGRPTTVPAAG